MFAGPWVAFVLTCGALCAQTSKSGSSSGVTVHLEPHESKTDFLIGDPVFVDLVFSGGSAKYSIDTDSNSAQPSGDQIYVVPDGGWVRSHQGLIGKGINGNALVALGGDEVRVPVPVNRVILFQKPGDYDISIATQRVVSEFRRVEPLDCDPCPATNAVRIHVAERSESEESALVKTLSDVLERTHEQEPADDEAKKAAKLEMQREFEREMERLQNMADSPEKDAEQKRLIKTISGMADERMRGIEQRARDRRIAAERLAYLGGDDAVRAKVHFIEMNANRTDADVMSFILIDGLAASRNKRLQVDLLEENWRDPAQIPSEVLHMALYEARVLLHETMVRDTNWGLTAEERKAYWDEFAKDLELIVATLPRRSGENRLKAIEFLKKTGVPNAFNQRKGQ